MLTTSTQSDAIAAVNAVYARLKGPAVGDNYDYWTVRHFALTDLTTDVGHCSYGGDPGQLSLAQWNSSNGLLGKTGGKFISLLQMQIMLYTIFPRCHYLRCCKKSISFRNKIFKSHSIYGFN